MLLTGKASKTFPGDKYYLATRDVIFAEKFCPGKGLLTTSKNFLGDCARDVGAWKFTDALIGNEVVSCLYLFHGYDGYDVIFLNCVGKEENSVKIGMMSYP